jgi:hypothetical protein
VWGSYFENSENNNRTSSVYQKNFFSGADASDSFTFKFSIGLKFTIPNEVNATESERDILKKQVISNVRIYGIGYDTYSNLDYKMNLYSETDSVVAENLDIDIPSDSVRYEYSCFNGSLLEKNYNDAVSYLSSKNYTLLTADEFKAWYGTPSYCSGIDTQEF